MKKTEKIYVLNHRVLFSSSYCSMSYVFCWYHFVRVITSHILYVTTIIPNTGERRWMVFLLKTIYIIRIKCQRQWEKGERLYPSFLSHWEHNGGWKENEKKNNIQKQNENKECLETHTYVFNSIFHLMHLCCLLFIRVRCSIIVRQF